jgi:hypothetical protein
MAEFVELGADPAGTPLSIEDVARVAREGAEVRIGDAASAWKNWWRAASASTA